MKEDNRKAIALLDERFSEPDDMGEEFWDEYEGNLTGGKAQTQQLNRDKVLVSEPPI